jgi:hypothetical protein
MHTSPLLKEYNSTGHECAVCLTNCTQETHTLDCGHVYHTTCIDKWLISHGTCPMCRHIVKKPGKVKVIIDKQANILESDIVEVIEHLPIKFFTSNKFFVDERLVLTNAEGTVCHVF